MSEYEPIRYPDGHIACPAGQKTVANEVMQLVHDPSGSSSDEIKERAKAGRRAVKSGADTPKRNLLSLIASILAHDADNHIDVNTGEYTIHSAGKKYQRHASNPRK